MKIPTFQTVITEGLMKVKGHQKCVHVLVEPSPKCMSVFVPGNTSEIIPGEWGVAVVFRNLSGSEVTLEPHTEVGKVTAANIVPSIQIPDELDMGENEKIQCMSVQADLSEGTSQRVTEFEGILKKIDLSGIDEWDPKIQQEAWDLIDEFVFIFSQNDFDLAKTLLSNTPSN